MAVRGRPFPKGVSGNPSGRRPTSPDVKLALQALTMEAVKVLGKVLRGDIKPPASGPRARAAETILNRVYGTPRQTVEVQEAVPYVALLPPVTEDGDQWERQANRVLATHGMPRPVPDEPQVEKADEWTGDQRHERRRGPVRRDGVEFAEDPPPPPDRSSPHAGRRTIRRR